MGYYGILFYKKISNFCFLKECDYFEYNSQVTESSFPTEWFFNMSKVFPISGYPAVVDRISKINSFAEAKNHYISFNIYYNDLTYQLIEESPYWDIFMLFSNIGGNLGLFVGMSFLSFVEIFELMFQILEFFIIKFLFKKSSTSPVLPFTTNQK